METTKLKNFAQKARTTLIEQIATKLKFVRAEESLARRENPIAVKKLEDLINQQSEQEVVERIAYIWFNRFCALRFMDMNRYNRSLVVSAATGDTQPEVLALAKTGELDDRVVSVEVRDQILNLLSGKAPSRNPEAEVYRLLLVAYCNQWHASMPFLFQRIDDYTELLMPDDLLSSSSVMANMREAMPASACEDVEVIGWLYQFYISDKKDDVFADLKKNKKVTPENIPAATQLFTPHWIVRYLVENSLGRLWLLNYPESKLADCMEYYIKPAEDNDDTDYLRVASPEDLKICDPACGSGHMLTYAFDLLYAIYEEQGYDAIDIPSRILTHNLYGIEIDERAGELAAFALTMKARDRHRRFFNTGVRPNICVLEPIDFDDDELNEYMDFIGRDLFTADLETTLRQFDEVNNFGSLIRPKLKDVAEILEQLEATDVSGQLFLGNTHQKVLKLLKQADYLIPQYHVVVANPPYMGGGGMNERLKNWSKINYPNSKSDLFAMFIELNLDLTQKLGIVAMITMHSWMFLKSYENLREYLLEYSTILSMAHLGTRAFDSIGGEVVSTTAFILKNANNKNQKGSYLRLVEGKSESEKESMISDIKNNKDCELVYYVSATDLKKIDGSPIAYWVSDRIRECFDNPNIKSLTISDGQTKTGNNDKYLRYLWEVSNSSSGINKKWIKHPKGGGFRRWYGNLDTLINWSQTARQHYRSDRVARILPEYLRWKKGFCWTLITSGKQSFRIINDDEIFNLAAPTLFPKDENNLLFLLGLVNTPITEYIAKLMNPTINLNVGDIQNIPLIDVNKNIVNSNVELIIGHSKEDWDSYEDSWDFTNLPLLKEQYRKSKITDAYKELRIHWQQMTDDMQRLEEDNNRIFINAYGLQDELTPEVTLKEITLTCNPYYRYGGVKTDDELEALLLADTMRELISYAVGCMFGRYSLDKPGLILANQGDKIEHYTEQVPSPSFSPDKNNVIPILDAGWFSDDIVERFLKFIKIGFGEEHYESNMQFIELALGKHDKPRDIRDYFLKDFYNDHIKRYKKRPIYWLFSSGNFNALIYMHRYQPDTVSIVLNDYLREFRTKLTAYKDQLTAINISSNQSQSEKTKALKELDKTTKMITEMEEYERDVLYPLATKQIEIDLDDGVKVNYPKFGNALKKVAGLS
ncbi:BREX-1 system adenine-specific DNA-methyltransferase PglX [Psychrobacter sp. LV10R520-6]|uniref:BREX-1 system adenine-specific DNA-methyltransferase PglX n=1 Tax=Psychrobacter sp. LV10R520-6 TaxID=1415574 RepID=UPI0024CC78F7|nr:BREX-1 system adenine-specific DNA-methyltransferase PglX [Psychrobacter sp. LV10R520-6]SNT70097.1 Type II restriction/modification system, DNA methylase subunit YeeA [Psychrobacter sp. LV10R520-6]